MRIHSIKSFVQQRMRYVVVALLMGLSFSTFAVQSVSAATPSTGIPGLTYQGCSTQGRESVLMNNHTIIHPKSVRVYYYNKEVRGDINTCVTSLQTDLNAEFYSCFSSNAPPLTEDGDFGPKTEAAVKLFQSAISQYFTVNGKPIDPSSGQVGAFTWGVIRFNGCPLENGGCCSAKPVADRSRAATSGTTTVTIDKKSI